MSNENNNGVTEIERKWIISDPSESLSDNEFMYVEQAYISFEPTVRIRKMMDKDHKTVGCYQTFKGSGSKLSRPEIEFPISEASYDALMSEFVDPAGIIIKKYYRVTLQDSHVYEISEVDGDWWYLEVEFAIEEDANAFVLDSYVTDNFNPVEVTGKKNSSIAAYSKFKIDRCKLELKSREYNSWGMKVPSIYN